MTSWYTALRQPSFLHHILTILNDAVTPAYSAQHTYKLNLLWYCMYTETHVLEATYDTRFPSTVPDHTEIHIRTSVTVEFSGTILCVIFTRDLDYVSFARNDHKVSQCRNVNSISHRTCRSVYDIHTNNISHISLDKAAIRKADFLFYILQKLT
jgi:hypothetical protein